MSTEPNERLLDDLRAGDPSAFEQIYVAERTAVYGFLRRLAGDSHVAADLFQNVWLKLAKHSSRLRPGTNLRAWLLTVARHEFVSYRRAQALDLSRLLTLGLERQGEVALAAQLTPQLDELAAALTKLHDRDREVLLLTRVAGLAPEEAARALGISPVALRQRLARARKRLGAALQACALAPEAACPSAPKRARG